MPRYRTPRASKPPKPPKPPKPIRPKVRDLRGIYKGLITTDVGQRLDILLYGIQWYKLGMDYLVLKQKGGLTSDQMKSKEKALKCQTQAQSTTFVGEKEMAYRRALIIMEGICKDLEPPKLEDYYKLLDKKKAKLEAKTERWEEKYGDTINLFKKILKPMNQAGQEIEMEIAPIAEPVHKDAELKRLVFRPDVAKLIHKKRFREGVLAAVLEPVEVLDRTQTPPQLVSFSFLEELIRLSAMERQMDQNQDWTGQYIAKEGLQKMGLFQMLRNLTEWGRTDEAPKRLVRMARVEQPPLQPGQAPKPRQPRPVGFAGKRGVLLEGSFQDGTDIAKLFVTLKAKAGQWVQKKELQAMISTKLDGRLQVIEKKARGRWHVEKNGPEVRLVMAPAQP